MFRFLWNLFQQHIDAWIGAIATTLPTFGAPFYFVYQRIRLGDAGRKDRCEVEKAKQEIQLSQTSDITIVRSLARDNNGNSEIDRSSQHRTYYILAHHPVQIDKVIQVIQAYENVAKDSIITGHCCECACFFAKVETYTLQEKLEASLRSKSEVLPSLDNPLPVATTPPELPVIPSVPLRADVLLVTVTEVETNAVLNVFRKKLQHSYQRYCVGIKTYYDLGTVNNAHVFLVQSEMGVSGTGGSLFTVHEGIQTLAPSSVIMAGIAFGVDPHKQHIGDVLVSKQLHGYELQRYGTACDGTPRIVPRGDRVTASVKLLDRFRSGALDWSSRGGRRSRQVHFGTILSGETLVDNIDYRDQLRTLEPEAIGGEMEGVGLYAAAQNAKVDWILVKAICDWADGNKSGEKVAVSYSGESKMKNVKEHYQRIAANNAARFIMHVLDKTRLV